MIRNLQDKIRIAEGVEMPGFGLGLYKAKAGDEVYSAVRMALDAGYRHIDTATFYENEADVGRAVKDSGIPREELFVATKLWPTDFQKAQETFEKSLSYLNTGYIDLYMLHWPGTDETLRYRAWDVILGLREKGLIRAAGVSNFIADQLADMKRKTGEFPANNQVELHPWFQQRELRSFCRQNGISVTAWGPIFHGHLSEEPLMEEIGGHYGKSAAQATLRWHIQNEIAVIPKSVHRERIASNADVFDFELSQEDIERINALDGKQRFSWDSTKFDGDAEKARKNSHK
ncbi:aldo/keto reductase [Christensenella intestinihominis]|uniref:aldo/keto reductase n=1 Tax=Christensenella intestinihominis TaxID=1851429 RepID=UPI000830F8E0|nr:aldo/keto reductase [Christensenella intestinihominis]